MAVAANYIVVMDGKKRLKSGASFNVACPTPSNMAANWAPVLTFMVDSVGSVDDFKFHVDVFPWDVIQQANVYSHLIWQPLSQCAGGIAGKSHKRRSKFPV